MQWGPERPWYHTHLLPIDTEHIQHPEGPGGEGETRLLELSYMGRKYNKKINY